MTRFILSILLIGLLLACTELSTQETTPIFVDMDQIKGVTLDSRNVPPAETLPDMAAHGVTHVTVIPYGWMPKATDAAVRWSKDAGWFTESASGIKKLSQDGEEYGISVIIKPQIWIGGGGGAEDKWTGAIRFDTEEDWQSWESDYHDYIMYYANLAQEVNAASFSLGVELGSSTNERPQFWRQLAADVREVYDGKVTYGANWYDEYEVITFWDALDYIGIHAYFPLVEHENTPTKDELSAGWVQFKTHIETVQQKFNKPIVFTELGYRSVDYAAREPWRWPSRSEIDVTVIDNNLQKELYETFFETFWHESWFKGAVIWKWYPPTEELSPYRKLDFTPQNKPAGEVMKTWFLQES